MTSPLHGGDHAFESRRAHRSLFLPYHFLPSHFPDAFFFSRDPFHPALSQKEQGGQPHQADGQENPGHAQAELPGSQHIGYGQLDQGVGHRSQDDGGHRHIAAQSGSGQRGHGQCYGIDISKPGDYARSIDSGITEVDIGQFGDDQNEGEECSELEGGDDAKWIFDIELPSRRAALSDPHIGQGESRQSHKQERYQKGEEKASIEN